MSIERDVDHTGFIEDDLHTVAFKHMKVSMPIVSMAKCVKAGNELHITEDGGIHPELQGRKDRPLG